MLEWNVLKRGEHRAPGVRGRRLWRAWRRALGLLLLLIALVAAWVWREAEAREARLLAALEQTALDEERAMRFRVVEQARDFADPAAPPEWRFCYEASYRTTPPDLSAPILSIEAYGPDRAIVLLDYGDGGEGGGRNEVARAYRLVGAHWRRAPHVPENSSDATSPHFRMLPSPATVDLSLDLEGLREHVLARWPTNTCEECLVSLTVIPHPKTPALYGVNAQRLCLNDPTLALPGEHETLGEAEQYHLALVTGVVRALTMPVWLPEYPPARPPSSEKILAEGKEGEWLALLLMLQEAEARHWLLSDEQQRAIRNSWREELDGRWSSPFEGALPFYPEQAPEDARRRWLLVNLLIERAVVHGGDDTTLGHLARTLLAYRPETFDAQRFFTALIGGSLADLELLSRGYVLTLEE